MSRVETSSSPEGNETFGSENFPSPFKPSQPNYYMSTPLDKGTTPITGHWNFTTLQTPNLDHLHQKTPNLGRQLYDLEPPASTGPTLSQSSNWPSYSQIEHCIIPHINEVQNENYELPLRDITTLQNVTHSNETQMDATQLERRISSSSENYESPLRDVTTLKNVTHSNETQMDATQLKRRISSNSVDGEQVPKKRRSVPKNYEKNLRAVTRVELDVCTTPEARLLADIDDIVKQFRFSQMLNGTEKTNLFNDLVTYLLEFARPKVKESKIKRTTVHTIMQIVPEMKANTGGNTMLNLQIEETSGFLDSHRIPLLVAQGLMVYYEGVRPYFIKPEGLSKVKRYMQSENMYAAPYYVDTEPFFVNSWGSIDFKARNSKELRLGMVSILLLL